MIRYDVIRYGTITYRHNTIQYDTIRYDMIRYDTIRYDTRYKALARTRRTWFFRKKLPQLRIFCAASSIFTISQNTSLPTCVCIASGGYKHLVANKLYGAARDQRLSSTEANRARAHTRRRLKPQKNGASVSCPRHDLQTRALVLRNG